MTTVYIKWTHLMDNTLIHVTASEIVVDNNRPLRLRPKCSLPVWIIDHVGNSMMQWTKEHSKRMHHINHLENVFGWSSISLNVSIRMGNRFPLFGTGDLDCWIYQISSSGLRCVDERIYLDDAIENAYGTTDLQISILSDYLTTNTSSIDVVSS